MEKIRVGVISLGCDKNRVDTEKMLGILSDEFLIVDNPESADVIIINTCAFLESARKEAIEEILWASALKGYNSNLKLIVTGCLPQKFVGDIFEELPEVDAFLGVSDYADIKEVIYKTPVLHHCVDILFKKVKLLLCHLAFIRLLKQR